MNRYKFDVSRVVECLTPTYLQGRHLRNLIKAIVSPLQSLNEQFELWAHDMEIANKVTSQKILLEKYLTNCLKAYFIDNTSSFVVHHKNPITVDMYVFNQGTEDVKKQLYVYKRHDFSHVADREYSYRAGFLGASFYVEMPKFNDMLISQEEYEAKVKAIIDRYKLASKNYKLMYQQ